MAILRQILFCAGVSVTNGLSVSPHVQSAVIASCAQALYALRVLRAHGLSHISALQTIFRAVVVAKLTYVSSAWLGFTTAHDRQRIDAFYPRDAMLARVFAIATCPSVRLSVCLSVRPSVTRRYCA